MDGRQGSRQSRQGKEAMGVRVVVRFVEGLVGIGGTHEEIKIGGKEQELGHGGGVCGAAEGGVGAGATGLG